METFNVEVIQYMRPHGTQIRSFTSLPKTHQSLFAEMILHGCRFEAEMVQPQVVHISISNREEDLADDIVPNGPKVQEAMVKLLEKKPWQKSTPRRS